jgi:aspartate/methionine/tyrosine aminotransferase
VSIIAENLPIFDGFFDRWSDYFEWEHPQGGCVCFPRYLGGDGVEAFCQDLLHDAGVVLLPASIFRPALADVPTTTSASASLASTPDRLSPRSTTT